MYNLSDSVTDGILKNAFVNCNLYDEVLKTFKVDCFECSLEEERLAYRVQNNLILSFTEKASIHIPYKEGDIITTLEDNHNVNCVFSGELIKAISSLLRNIPQETIF